MKDKRKEWNSNKGENMGRVRLQKKWYNNICLSHETIDLHLDLSKDLVNFYVRLAVAHAVNLFTTSIVSKRKARHYTTWN